ncbi:MAG TPA: metal-dependent hydrolase [Gammaproteobacteria bacterium]|nr:metal-dependent hydrolase [Gammaproteobacteria bacterium]
MDPVCHTLVGASLSATGLGRTTRFGCATLLVAANLPDVDAATYFLGDPTTAYAVRRGITHGLPAMIVLPVALALAVKALDRLWPSPYREAPFKWLLALAALGVASHPALDWLNNYGMRWLMPFVDRWWYGDTLFIIDWIVWLLLGTGLVMTRMLRDRALRWHARPASIAIGVLMAYVSVNYTLTQLAEREVLASVTAPPLRIMASPAPFDPLRRDIVLEYDGEYRLGTVRFEPAPRFEAAAQTVPKGNPAWLERARESLQGRQFLSWARFPYALVEDRGEGTLLWIADARYAADLDNPRRRNFGYIALEP